MPWPEHLKPRKPEPLPDIDLKALFNETPAVPQLIEAGGVFFLSLSPNDRAGIAYTVERLINMLDAMDGDEDVEVEEDHEPYLGWPNAGQPARLEMCNDREVDNVDYEDGGDNEPNLGSATCAASPYTGRYLNGSLYESRDATGSQINWTNGGDVGDREEEESGFGDASGMTEELRGEPELGWTEEIDQERRLESEATWMVSDGEPLLGWCENAGMGVRKDEPADDREYDAGDDRECHDGDYEESLGWREQCSQRGIGTEAWSAIDAA